MDWLHAIVFGVTQGLTEFLPVSSSGHLIIVPWLFKWDEPGLAFDAALHLGTLLAVLIYFWRDIFELASALPTAVRNPRLALSEPSPLDSSNTQNARLALLLIIGCIPGGVAGLLLQNTVDDFFHNAAHRDRAIVIISILLIVFAIFLFLADRFALGDRRIKQQTIRDSVVIGLAQGFAVFAGTSRSGVTLTAGLASGVRRADAARFSFLLGAPIIAAAGLQGVMDLIKNGAGEISTAKLIGAVVVSAVTGALAISGLMRYLQRASTTVFVVYRILLGLALIALVIAR
jgi:undecaprenyl-diphosphatase